MLFKRKILPLLIASAMLTACGGGGDDSSPKENPPPVNNTNPQPINNNPQTPPDTTPEVVPDQKLNGHMTMVANQILFIRTNRVIYLPVQLQTMERELGLVDMAAGSTIPFWPDLKAHADREGCTIAIDGTCAVQPPFVAPAAPIAAFGIRINTHLSPSEPGQQVANQKAVGRIAFDLTERPDSRGIRAGEVAEIMRFVIDNVEITTGADGRITDVKMGDNAQIHVYGRSANGTEVRESIPAPPRTVRLLPLVEVPDHNNDNTSIILLMDLETGFSQAGERLAALHNIAGYFTMDLTLSHVDKIHRPDVLASPLGPAQSAKDLIGKTITVGDQPPVSGAGLIGNAWIRMYP